MSDHHEMTKTTPMDFAKATLGGLFAPGLAIFLIVMLVIGIQSRMGKQDADVVADKAVRERIAPFGVSIAVDPNKPRVDMTGEQVYNEVCTNCHGSGALGSPKHKDTGAWAKRIAQGWPVLLDHGMKGFNKMPARGGEPDLSDLEVARAIAFMTNAVGAKFEPVLQKERIPTAEELIRGKAVYAENCATCHDTGVTGAQKLSDAQAWESLLKQGKDYLYTAAIKGSFGGPAKGGNEKLSDTDTRMAVDYMAEQAKAAIAKGAKPEKKAAK